MLPRQHTDHQWQHATYIPQEVRPLARRKRPAAERFAERVDRNGPISLRKGAPGRCWTWTGYVRADGYGQFWNGTRNTVVHRWAYEQQNGPVGADLDCDHLCRRRECCNPDHVEPVTRRENVRRGIGPSAANARKSHCDHGHPLADAYRTPDGSRMCRTCTTQRVNAREKKLRTDPAWVERRRAQQRAAYHARKAKKAAAEAARTSTPDTLERAA